jgi:Zn-dependent peptidase ImmA (M78 family)
MAATRTKAARDAAKRLVKEHALRKPVDVEGLANKLGYDVRREAFENSLSGLYVAKHRVIGVNKTHSETRQRFTIAHEIGHATLHADDNDAALFLDESPVHLRVTGAAPDGREIEANRFAAEILMPEDEIRSMVQRSIEIYEFDLIVAMAEQFIVSPQAFTARLVELELTPRPVPAGRASAAPS